MILTKENYFSLEAQKEFFSVSQYKDFIGSLGRRGCEAMAMAKLTGQWQQELSTAMLVGSYIDAHFEGTLNVFCAQHPEICTQKGELRSEYKGALEVIARIERDPYFMLYLTGEKQRIFKGEIFGVEWKCKVDCFVPGVCITDLKIMRDLRESFWVKDYGYMSFVENWGYDIQAAVYQKLVEINTANQYPFYIAAASKEKYPDIEIIGFKQFDLDDCLSTIQPNIERIRQLKLGQAKPTRCEQCDFCKATKVLNRPLHYSDLVFKI